MASTAMPITTAARRMSRPGELTGRLRDPGGLWEQLLELLDGPSDVQLPVARDLAGGGHVRGRPVQDRRDDLRGRRLRELVLEHRGDAAHRRGRERSAAARER